MNVRSGCLPWCLQIFLEPGQYQAVETSRQEAAAAGKGKASKDRIHRTIGRQRPIRYEITDKAPTDKATWDRVVALFCLGKAWQFKTYPKALFPVSVLTKHFDWFNVMFWRRPAVMTTCDDMGALGILVKYTVLVTLKYAC